MKTWLDVGAHKGEYTLRKAKVDKNLMVYAFEPNPVLAAKLKAPSNYRVYNMAIGERDGLANFYLCSDDAASSLLPFSPEGIARWKSNTLLATKEKTIVRVTRLDTFMDEKGITHVDFLKIDTQGTDLSVVKSAGARLKDIDLVTLEVIVTPYELYKGNDKKTEILAFMEANNFRLIGTDKKQSYGQAENLTFRNRGAAEITGKGR